MPWFPGRFQRPNRRACVKPGSEDQLVSGNLSNLRVASLEGIRAFVPFRAFSDKAGPFRAFENKQLVGAVRKDFAVQYPPSFLKGTRQLAPRSRASGGDR